jgi:glycosyltransferase involved in cell wall biosynthesis
MQHIRPKYSIIIPARNGGKYLPTCVDTIISQDYCDYELIISDDHSVDGSKEYLATLSSHPNVIVIEPKEPLSMAEHWEWALSHARGEWLIFVGQDDGLQPYFFRLADRLTEIAKKWNLRTIMSERAYFFWKDCGFVYGDIAVRYYARNAIKIHNCRYEAMKALFGLQTYFNLPEMYTTSLFHSDIVREAKRKQQGRLFLTHPQDANLAAIACSLEKRYLMSSIPLGWVGSSLKSAGMAVTQKKPDLDANDKNNDLGALKKEYVDKVNKSKIGYNFLAGDFEFGNLGIYFWQSFLQTPNLRGSLENRILQSKIFRIILFCQVLNEINSSGNSDVRLSMFKEILKRNKCSFATIYLGSKVSTVIAGIILISSNMIQKVLRIFSGQIYYSISWSEDDNLDMHKASSRVKDLITEKKWLNNLL